MGSSGIHSLFIDTTIEATIDVCIEFSINNIAPGFKKTELKDLSSLATKRSFNQGCSQTKSETVDSMGAQRTPKYSYVRKDNADILPHNIYERRP